MGMHLTPIGWFDAEEALDLSHADGNTFDTLLFHESWDWLIPVIEKCKESQIFGSQRLITNIYNRLLELDILATHANVVDFIEFYNQNKPQQC